VVGGAALTPEQQLARNLQLPLTQPVHLPPGTPGPRRILQQLHVRACSCVLHVLWPQSQDRHGHRASAAPERFTPVCHPPAACCVLCAAAATALHGQDAQSWQELEAALYQYSPQQQQAPAAARPATGQAAESPQQQQQQQQQAGVLPPAAKQRRKQPVRTLSVPINVGSSSAASQPLEPQPQPQPPAAAQRAQQLRLPDQQQQQQVLNALHISEAFQRLAVLLPHRPQALAAQDRARVTALLAHLCALAARLCESCDMDARGCAQLALNLSKLGQRDSQLIAALQDAVLGQVGAFSARQTAVLLVGLAKLDARCVTLARGCGVCVWGGGSWPCTHAMLWGRGAIAAAAAPAGIGALSAARRRHTQHTHDTRHTQAQPRAVGCAAAAHPRQPAPV
jgi:hypothetical protein